MNHTHNSQRCLVLAGGGFRFVYHLGFYHALCQRGWQADLLLTSCGGMLAAHLIKALPDAKAQRQFLQSQACWQWFSQLRTTPAARMLQLAPQILRRLLAMDPCTMTELQQQALVHRPPLLDLSSAAANGPAVVSIACQLLPTARGFSVEQTILAPPHLSCWLAERLNAVPAPLSHYSGSRVLPKIKVLPVDCLQTMSDIAVTDPYYFAPYLLANPASHGTSAMDNSGDCSAYLGGAVDLQPIALALQLSQQVIAQRKDRFDRIASQPALRRVFGVDMNAHLAKVEQNYLQHPRVHWADVSDMRQQLPLALLTKHWRAAKLQLTAPATLGAWQQLIDAHWHYGTQRGHACPLPVL